ncbi:MAG: hypothetical protein JRH20_28375 [Deltaproteobacteria bacterium]|nr:hypothetical protein [Deltaproteobacteria bacterium]
MLIRAKALYDRLVSLLAGWTLLFALVAGLFYLLTWLVFCGLFDFDSLPAFWRWAGRRLPGGALGWRLAIFGVLHAAWLWQLRRRLPAIHGWLQKTTLAIVVRPRGWARRHPRLRLTAGICTSLLITLLLVPFFLQPTLFPPTSFRARTWGYRLANLIDGRATVTAAESVLGFYHRVVGVEPKLGPGVDELGYKASFGRGERARPLMDRWDPLIREVVGDNPRSFATLKAFLWVESGGRQFALSTTGCAGLMQFCTRTARARPYGPIFGAGRIFPCDCGGGRCKVSLATRRALESGDAGQVGLVARSFPCDLGDGRFDAERSLRAGWVYIKRLSRAFGGNRSLMYIAYNSGPSVAKRVWRGLGRRRHAMLRDIRPHLVAALRPSFGAAAERRARSLSRNHLLKLDHAFRRYFRAAKEAQAKRREGLRPASKAP